MNVGGMMITIIGGSRLPAMAVIITTMVAMMMPIRPPMRKGRL